MPEKQTTFFTINCAEKLEYPNQCWLQNREHGVLQLASVEFDAQHWLADSIFLAQFTVKNVVCFSEIFH
jgi:hypothetical protein